MDNKTKNAPMKIVILWIGFISVNALLYSYLPHGWKGIGFVGLLMSTIAACNTCYKIGFEDARSKGT